jgi:hypothetical protein
VLVTVLSAKKLRGGGLQTEDIETLKYLISVTPQEVLLQQSSDGCTALWGVLSDIDDMIDFQNIGVFKMARLLFDACPAVARLLSGGSFLPFELFSNYCRLLNDSLVDVYGPDSLETRYPEVTLLLRDLCAATGDAIFETGMIGWPCLHRMCRKPWLPALRMVCEAYPEALRVNVPCVGAPLHVVLGSAAYFPDATTYIMRQCPEAIAMRVSGFGQTALNIAASDGKLTNVEFFQNLYDHNPSAIREKDANGDLPLHCYIQGLILNVLDFSSPIESSNEPVFFPVLRWFLRLYPESADVANVDGLTPYDLVLAIYDTNSSNRPLLRLFLMTCPYLDRQRLWDINYGARRGALHVIHHLRQSPLLPLSSSTAHRVGKRDTSRASSQMISPGGDCSPPAQTEGAEDEAVVGTGVSVAVNDTSIGNGDSIVLIWRLLANRADISLLKEVVSFL